MTLMELFQNDTEMQKIISLIMGQRTRMRYRHAMIQNEIQERGLKVERFSVGQVYELHYILHPDQPRRVPKSNLTRPRRK